MHYLRNFLIILTLLFGVSFFVFTSSSPEFVSTPLQPNSMAVIKNALSPLRGRTDASEFVTIHLSNQELEAAAALGGQAVQPAIVSSQLTGQFLQAGLSYPLPLGRWLNVEALLPKQEYKGVEGELPPFTLRIGRVTLPSFASRPLFSQGLRIIQRKYPDIPDLHQILKGLSFSDNMMNVTVQLPRSGELFRQATSISGSAVDAALVKGKLCQLVDAQNAEPSNLLSEQIKRAFSANIDQSGAELVKHNRASLVALAIFSGDARVQRVFYANDMKDSACPIPLTPQLLLAGRSDLAKHWAVSAAMAATLGVNVTGAVGEWKELSDSLPHGSGFSFVDIAADQSGFRYGKAAVDEMTATDIRDALLMGDSDRLLPKTIMTFEEGITDESFAQTYSNLNSPEYKQMIKRIEVELDKVGVPK